MMSLISIIIPVYQVERYLDRCLQSVISQTYKDLEIILIDDGSTDNSGLMCDKYSEMDRRIKVIHQNNQGLAAVRNMGIKNCTGEFITFIDSDDYVDLNYCGELFQMIQESGADLSICDCDMVYEYDQRSKNINKNSISRSTFTTEQALKELFYQRSFDTSVCGKLYRKELFSNTRFPDGKLYEDLATVYRLFYGCKKIAYTSHTKYYYLQRTDSIVGSSFNENKMDSIEFVEEMCDSVKQNYPACYTASLCRLVSANFNIYFKIPGDKDEFEYCRSQIETNIRKHRGTVISDKEARPKARIACLLTYLGFPALRFLWDLGLRG